MKTEFNRFAARVYAGNDYEGVTHAGIAIVAADSGRVLVVQRAPDLTDTPEVAESWEFPGGSVDPGEDPFTGAMRELIEECGFTIPEDGTVVNGWRAPNGVYQGFVVQTATEFPLAGWTPTDEVQGVAWISREDAQDMPMRPEMADFDWSVLDAAVSGNKESDMLDQPKQIADETPAEDATDTAPEPDYSNFDFAPEPLMIHGILAPEAAPSGDQRGFTAGAVTARPLRLPFGWQEWTAPGHDSSITVAGIDRMMRKDGMIHFEGTMMSTPKADEFTELLSFFGKYGTSIDGVNGQIDAKKSAAEGMVWFDAVKIAGAVGCSIPAFAEAYVALGPHPDMPEGDNPDALAASGLSPEDIIGAQSFSRGPGWATNPKETKRIHDYWTKKGQPGYAKIRWGTRGDFTRAKALIGEKIAKHSPGKMRFLNQIIAQWHHDALGYWPGDLDMPGNKTTAEAKAERAAKRTAASVEAADGIQTDEAGQGWEAVLVSSAGGGRVTPPASYFTKHPDSGALVIEEPDEFGLRRTYGYAGEWGVCHIGRDGRCVEVPEDPTGEYTEFHLGRTKTDEGYINTGVITYKVDHRDAATILSQTAEQQHFDNIAHAWAAVRLGQDENGVWFSGVVLPGISEEDCTLIEATGQVSGEWKYGALRALQSVNVPGFPVLRSSAAYDDEGNVVALVASTYGATTDGCEPTAFERMQALAAIDAEVRFQKLREEWS